MPLMVPMVCRMPRAAIKGFCRAASDDGLPQMRLTLDILRAGKAKPSMPRPFGVEQALP